MIIINNDCSDNIPMLVKVHKAISALTAMPSRADDPRHAFFRGVTLACVATHDRAGPRLIALDRI